MIRWALKDTKTGEVRYGVDEYATFDAAKFQWTEGNYACDCNRALFFARAHGELDPPDSERECSMKNRYELLRLWCDVKGDIL